MPNVRLIVEYDGADFHGWQSQPGLRTVQSELHRVLELVIRERIPHIVAASRTDAGVHARGQVVNFRMQGVPDLRRLRHSVSNILRGEVAVIAADIVPDSFHATTGAKCKQYTYTMIVRDSPLVLERGRAWHIAAELNIERMQEAAKEILGRHDFSSFRGSHCTASTTIKNIFESEVVHEPPYVRYRVIGSAFLKQMVRNLVGTMVGIGKGRLPSMSEIIAARDRTKAGVTAPAWGLCLDWVRYETEGEKLFGLEQGQGKGQGKELAISHVSQSE